ncbi:MAG: hypothetical protein J0M35_20435 [Candidatus Obscuribacter phosphatis]|uniref:Uncharacterized protein n=1 Tax=Candidatus Obscuribacter phosphatis TaxID=1906157 RepID=A0A8J7PLJ0_9BACT|nr:hypothetical protein [Candidatus Obscuribacter phosphatis]
MVLFSLPDHEVPPPLASFAESHPGVEYNSATNEIILYHGTNCYRRWEINRSGFIEPGRSNYSFYSTRQQDAYAYARMACMRDVKPDSVSFNSLSCEPVVLRLKFNERTWLQVDFVNNEQDSNGLVMAVLGPIHSSNVVEVLHCNHGTKRLAQGLSIRTFEDGEFARSIQRLRENFQKSRLDMWVLRKLGFVADKVGVTLKGGEVPALTHSDQLRKLRQRVPGSDH